MAKLLNSGAILTALALLITANLTALEPFKAKSDDARSISLDGEWLFKIDNASKEGAGIKEKWFLPEHDDKNWETIRVGETWEKQGHNYNGVAWYRQRVFIPKAWEGEKLFFNIGRPDDRGIVWINGEKIREIKKFGPHFSFVLEAPVIKYGEENVIAVYIADWYMNGGLNFGEFSVERALPFAPEATSEGHKKNLKLSVTTGLTDDILSNPRWESGWRDNGLSDTRPKMSAARGAYNGEDAVSMNIWYPNSAGEYVDCKLNGNEDGSVWAKEGYDYISFWCKTDDTEGEIELRLNKGKLRWGKNTPSYRVKVYIKPGDWTRIILPFHAFRTGADGKHTFMTSPEGLDTVSLGYRNHELQRPGTVLFADFEVGSYSISPEAKPVSLAGLWRFKFDDTRPDGTPRDIENEKDKEGYGLELGWNKPDFDDSKWALIKSGTDWESQTKNYDGPAWYRQKVFIPEYWRGRKLTLNLGTPDDRGEVYWNGEQVAKVEKYGPAFTIELKAEQIKYGEFNQIAARVVDWYGRG
ncbi:MAG: beta galactosidase jelly roll domain-containing protein, partial [Planctomycetes bacterium]|nr:beta galactosidase jelly roll domain-containing protein [Planctomycetota bacterium]